MGGPSDPRHGITIDDLLHMRSGLEWVEEYEGTSDVIEMLFGEGSADRAHSLPTSRSSPRPASCGTTRPARR